MGNLHYPDAKCFNSQSKRIKHLNYSTLNQVFKKYSNNGFINNDSFNECIAALCQDESFPKIAYTYLAERLFTLIDVKKNNQVDFETFSQGMCMILSTSDTRMIAYFEVIKSSPNKSYVSYEQIYDFFLNSWVYSFNYIFKFMKYYYSQEFFQNDIPFPSNQDDFVAMINNQKETLHTYLVKNLYDSGISHTEPIYYEAFKNWALKDNTLEICYGNKFFRFATSVMFLEAIGLNITQ